MRLASASGGSGARRAIQDLYQDVRLCVNRGEWVKGELKVKLAHEEAGAQISLDFIPSDEAQEACELSLSHCGRHYVRLPVRLRTGGLRSAHPRT